VFVLVFVESVHIYPGAVAIFLKTCGQFAYFLVQKFVEVQKFAEDKKSSFVRLIFPSTIYEMRPAGAALR
jgi:hypothetical protein